jgi:hypothetical protein
VEAVGFQDNPLAVGKQEQEVHPEPQQGAWSAFLDGLVIPVQPHLGQERREVVHDGGVEVVVDGEQVPLRGELPRRLLISLPYSVFLASSSVI